MTSIAAPSMSVLSTDDCYTLPGTRQIGRLSVSSFGANPASD
jgi:hypothetical protein